MLDFSHNHLVAAARELRVYDACARFASLKSPTRPTSLKRYFETKLCAYSIHT